MEREEKRLINLFELLGVPFGCSDLNAIQAGYLTQKDKYKDNKRREDAIERAYRILKNPTSRRKYIAKKGKEELQRRKKIANRRYERYWNKYSKENKLKKKPCLYHMAKSYLNLLVTIYWIRDQWKINPPLRVQTVLSLCLAATMLIGIIGNCFSPSTFDTAQNVAATQAADEEKEEQQEVTINNQQNVEQTERHIIKQSYQIKPGDTLSEIVAKYPQHMGVTEESILKDNRNISDPDEIYAGDILTIRLNISPTKLENYTMRVSRKEIPTIGESITVDQIALLGEYGMTAETFIALNGNSTYYDNAKGKLYALPSCEEFYIVAPHLLPNGPQRSAKEDSAQALQELTDEELMAKVDSLLESLSPGNPDAALVRLTTQYQAPGASTEKGPVKRLVA